MLFHKLHLMKFVDIYSFFYWGWWGGGLSVNIHLASCSAVVLNQFMAIHSMVAVDDSPW